ncbi:type II toxin-antitoxin system RelE/ParE family toxin [Rhodocytophaga aerolata]|uniref:Toxin n=1 Tax=Rhodocytophaga aerolata TaxID=455078 RepID=A0ABT8RHC6_9BACT|nr:type II toxin-antitoxin system RelE/ParE family toxin [Rhodocytophaga aerolata]MDO1451485.1 type II toxin-antitoxin system RelE/ParE family toxin [Rhodocytophaga aerolata]
MGRYELSPAAAEDLIEIWVYLSDNASDKQADKMIDKIENQCQMLSQNPAMGKTRPELKVGLRSFPVNPYTIFYDSIAPGHIIIRRVLHQSRDIDRLMEQ